MKKIILFTVLGAGSVFGQAYWNVPNTSGLLEDPTSWMAGVVPGAGTSLTFNVSADYDVLSHTGLSSCGNITFIGTSGTVFFGLDTGMMLESTAYFNFNGSDKVGSQLNIVHTNGILSSRGHWQLGANALSRGTTALVSGPNTVIQSDRPGGAAYDVSCGGSGSWNTLIVTNGASLKAYRGVGVGTTTDAGRSGSNNLLRITGAGTFARSTTGNFMVGQIGAFNEMIIEKGALVQPGGIRVGYTSALGTQNKLTVREAAVVSNLSATCYVGDAGYANTLTAENPGTVLRLNAFSVGYNGRDNQFVARDGVLVNVYSFSLGVGASATGNQALFTDSGTKGETRSDDVMVGQLGNDNAMVISNGASFTCGRNLFVGKQQHYYSGSSSNLLWITGADSLFTCAGYMYCPGTNGFANEIRVSDGGTLLFNNAQAYQEAVIGFGTNTFGNRLVIESGGLFTNQIMLVCGRWGSTNEIVVRNGGKYTSPSSAYIGQYAPAFKNSLIVTNGGDFLVNGHVYLGFDLGTSLNEVLVSGAGSLVHNRDFDMDIGTQGNDNRMTVRDGGSVSVARGLFIGSRNANEVGSNNVLRVENGSLAVAGTFSGDANGRLQISNAGRIELIGTNSVVTTRYDLDLMRGSSLVLEIGKDGLIQTPIQVGRAVVSTNGVVQMQVSAAPWINRTGGTLTLLSCASASTAALNQLVSSAIAADEMLTGKLTVAADGKSILFSSPRRGGTILKLL